MTEYIVTRTVTWSFVAEAEDEESARDIVQDNIHEYEERFWSSVGEDWFVEIL